MLDQRAAVLAPNPVFAVSITSATTCMTHVTACDTSTERIRGTPQGDTSGGQQAYEHGNMWHSDALSEPPGSSQPCPLRPPAKYVHPSSQVCQHQVLLLPLLLQGPLCQQEGSCWSCHLLLGRPVSNMWHPAQTYNTSHTNCDRAAVATDFGSRPAAAATAALHCSLATPTSPSRGPLHHSAVIPECLASCTCAAVLLRVLVLLRTRLLKL
jgi:hypothetical protein